MGSIPQEAEGFAAFCLVEKQPAQETSKGRPLFNEAENQRIEGECPVAQYQSNPIRVHITRMQTTARAIRVDAGEYRRRGKSLFSTVSSSRGWEGQDAETFRNQLQGFQEDVEKMASLMESYADFLEQASQAYRSLQDAAVQQARDLWR